MDLESLQENLSRLEKVCQDLAKELELRSTQESSEAARFSVIVAKFTLMILTPTTLVFGYFTLPGTLIAFEPNSITLLISIVLTFIVVRLIFALLGTTWDTTRVWRIIGPYVRARRPENINIWLPMTNLYSLLDRRHTGNMETYSEDIEMRLTN
jgi:hypothetical protein